MDNLKRMKKLIICSICFLFLSISLLLGTTLAWFTDSETIGIESITSGNFDVVVTDANGDSLSGKTLSWNSDNSLWGPGSTHYLEEFYIENKGSLNLKFQIKIDFKSGDLDLLDVINFKALADASQLKFKSENAIITSNGTFDLFKGLTVNVSNSSEQYVTLIDYILEPGKKVGPIKISGTMSDLAGLEYDGKTLGDASLIVIASQFMIESHIEEYNYPSVETSMADLSDNASTIIKNFVAYNLNDKNKSLIKRNNF